MEQNEEKLKRVLQDKFSDFERIPPVSWKKISQKLQSNNLSLSRQPGYKYLLVYVLGFLSGLLVLFYLNNHAGHSTFSENKSSNVSHQLHDALKEEVSNPSKELSNNAEHGFDQTMEEVPTALYSMHASADKTNSDISKPSRNNRELLKSSYSSAKDVHTSVVSPNFQSSQEIAISKNVGQAQPLHDKALNLAESDQMLNPEKIPVNTPASDQHNFKTVQSSQDPRSSATPEFKAEEIQKFSLQKSLVAAEMAISGKSAELISADNRNEKEDSSTAKDNIDAAVKNELKDSASENKIVLNNVSSSSQAKRIMTQLKDLRHSPYSRFTMELYAAPESSNRKLRAADASTANWVISRNIRESKSLGWSAGANVNYTLLPFLAIGTGVVYTKTSYSGSYKDILKNSGVSYTSTMSMIGMPLNIHLYLRLHRFSFAVTNGLTLYKNIGSTNNTVAENTYFQRVCNTSGAISADDSDNDDDDVIDYRRYHPIRSTAPALTNQSFLIAYNSSVSLNYQVRERLTVSIGPTLRYSISSTYRQKLVREHLYNIGLQVGAKYYF